MITQHKENTISVLMENWRAAGTWLYPKEYFSIKDLPIMPYRPNNLVWFDIGDPTRLQTAREYFE